MRKSKKSHETSKKNQSGFPRAIPNTTKKDGPPYFSPGHSNMRIQRYNIATKSIYLQNPVIRLFQTFYHPSPPFPVLSLAITQPNPPPHFQIFHFFFGVGPVGVIDPSVSSSSSS